jgi:hypothetical protein
MTADVISLTTRCAPNSAYAIALQSCSAMECAQAAELAGDPEAADAHHARAASLRTGLSLTPAVTANDRLAHVVEAQHTAGELITALADEIVAKGLGWKARVLMALLVRIDEGDAEPATA